METKNLSLAYDRETIIQQLSLSIVTGEITTLVGPNGCGKSTLLRGLARLLKPKAGEVLLDGKAIHALPTKQLAKQLGILPQGPTAPEGLTVYELVAQGRYPHQGFFQQWSPEDEETTREAIAITNMVELADRPLDTLSGGQRQRAWIAMTLAQKTPILLLDEPTTFLDIGYQLEVMELIERLNRERQMTILLVLHDLNQAARYSQRMVVLNQGRIVADGTPGAVLTKELLANVFKVQANIVIDPDSGSPVCLPYRTAVPTPHSNGANGHKK
ncbi:MAG: ABC transporter ATP-binding protein [Chloroflexi bacterium]|nr:ABC transporter ATP-binding protein [Ardenticatenaceae bacterium]MBL1128658.1 ABC transporter ATP-binding protein [Chloroflexota bacterium]NOG34736.1 ABC transporter ATP-binding protein [Chloroflexota bacterium]GIK55053.1 MAG: iron-enterobactin transporter ATP-binding protein [Chloroflexota bacterium]